MARDIFFDLKGVLEELTDKVGLKGQVTYEPESEYTFLHPAVRQSSRRAN